MGLVGRADERLVIDELLDAARQGLSRTLVVTGPAGIGKTALLDYAVDAAHDLLVVRFTGVEHMTGHSDDGEALEMTLRTTQVYRREAGEWRLVHRHAEALGPVDLGTGRGE